jgi:hypothetical protein
MLLMTRHHVGEVSCGQKVGVEDLFVALGMGEGAVAKPSQIAKTSFGSPRMKWQPLTLPPVKNLFVPSAAMNCREWTAPEISWSGGTCAPAVGAQEGAHPDFSAAGWREAAPLPPASADRREEPMAPSRPAAHSST